MEYAWSILYLFRGEREREIEREREWDFVELLPEKLFDCHNKSIEASLINNK